MAGRRLTERQKQRIRHSQQKRRDRLTKQIDSALQDESGEHPREGRVITRYGKHLAVEDDAGQIHHCLFRQNLGHLVCGDQVVWQTTEKGFGVVTAVMERHTALQRPDYSGRMRPLASNLTQLILVLAPQPEPSGYLVDQYLAAAESIDVGCLIALNKIDLVAGEAGRALNRQLEIYEAIGYPLIRVSAKQSRGLDPLIRALTNHTSILVGQSGVGKSSLVNALLPDRDVQVGRLSDATGQGRHITSAATLYHLPQGGGLIDSPGVRSFRLATSTRQQLAQGFVEFRPYLGKCRFTDCRHDQEPGCALKQAVDAGRIAPQRLENFIHMVRESAG